MLDARRVAIAAFQVFVQYCEDLRIQNLEASDAIHHSLQVLHRIKLTMKITIVVFHKLTNSDEKI